MELEKIKFRHSVCKFWVLASVALGMFVAGLIIPTSRVISDEWCDATKSECAALSSNINDLEAELAEMEEI